jgi:hypothetical protein
MKQKKYDRSAEDLGNLVGLEHLNFMVPDQRLATLFYITGLGLTRDPYLVTGVVNMWVNVGRSQFHLPTGAPQVLRGRAGLVLPNLDQLVQRLEMVRKDLKDTRFGYKAGNGKSNRYVDVTCPWGNQFRCHAPDEERFGPVQLGMAYVEIDVPAGTADGIARFYSEVLGATTKVEKAGGNKAAHISAGPQQALVFRETKKKLPDYDGHHLQVYVTDFSGPHKKLLKRKMVTEESNQHQYRFLDIVDPKTGKAIYRLEHEIRSMTHPLFARPMINRNPAITNNMYAAGYQDFAWALPV